MGKLLKGALAAVVVGIAAGAGVAAAARLDTGWVWKQGGQVSYVGQPAGTPNLVAYAQGDVNFRAHHIRMMSDDADFQFVHPQSGPARVNAYYLGTATRTPILIGAFDGQDVTSLIVAGSAGQKADLQQWQLNGKTVAAIDGKGRLRLGSVTLFPRVVGGRVMLYAATPKGTQLVAAGATK